MKLQELCFKLYMFPWLAKLADWKGVCQYHNRATPFPLITLAPGATFPTATTPMTVTFSPISSTVFPITSTVFPITSFPTNLPTAPTTTASTVTTTNPTIMITNPSTFPPTTVTFSPLTSTQIPFSTITPNPPLSTTTQQIQVPITTTTQIPIIVNTLPPPFITTTLQPLTTTNIPLTTAQNPITTTPPSISITQLPITTTLLPITTTQLPITTTQFPITTTQFPITTTQLPISTVTILVPLITTTLSSQTTNPIPLTTNPIPITTNPIPITTTQIPFTTTPSIPAFTTTTQIPISTVTIPNPFLTTTQGPIFVTTTPLPITITTPSGQPLTTTQLPISTNTLPPPNLSTTQSAPLTTFIPTTQPQTTLSTIITTLPTTTNPNIVTSTTMNPNVVTITVPPFPVTTTVFPITTITPTFPTNLPTVPATTTCPPFPTVCPPNTPGGNFNAGEGQADCILDGTPGNCINFRYCSYIVSLIVQINQKKDDAIENYIRRSVCGFDNLDPMVCCPTLVFMDTSSPSGQQPFVFSSVNSQPPSPAQPILNPTFLPPSAPGSLPTNDRDKCGMTNATKTRVVGGINAQLGSYPWLAALGYRSSIIRYLCAGTLITQKHVLTAGHCIKDNLVLARLGEYDISSDNDGANPIDYNVELRITHESFDAKTISNDIGLLKLSQIVPITDFIRPICMPLADAIRYKDLTYYQPFVAGWGSISFKGPAATILQEVQLPILPLSECEFNYRLYFPNQVFDNRVLCAGYSQGGKDSCQGDSGGGLVLPELSTDGSYYYYNLVGIVSYGFECARAGFPGIYSRVTSFLPWIQQHVND